MGFIPERRWDKALSGILASLPLTLTAGGLLQKRGIPFHLSALSVLYRFSLVPLSLHLALSSLLWLSCSLTPSLVPSISPIFIMLSLNQFWFHCDHSSFCCVDSLSESFTASLPIHFSGWPCSEMAPVHRDCVTPYCMSVGVYLWETDIMIQLQSYFLHISHIYIRNGGHFLMEKAKKLFKVLGKSVWCSFSFACRVRSSKPMRC